MNIKVKCIDAGDQKNITKDKIYQVIESDTEYHTIINDKYYKSVYFIKRFETVIELVNYKLFINNKEKHIQADFIYTNTNTDTYQFYKNNNLIFVCPINSTYIEILDKPEKYK